MISFDFGVWLVWFSLFFNTFDLPRFGLWFVVCFGFWVGSVQLVSFISLIWFGLVCDLFWFCSVVRFGSAFFISLIWFDLVWFGLWWVWISFCLVWFWFVIWFGLGLVIWFGVWLGDGLVWYSIELRRFMSLSRQLNCDTLPATNPTNMEGQGGFKNNFPKRTFCFYLFIHHLSLLPFLS